MQSSEVSFCGLLMSGRPGVEIGRDGRSRSRVRRGDDAGWGEGCRMSLRGVQALAGSGGGDFTTRFLLKPVQKTRDIAAFSLTVFEPRNGRLRQAEVLGHALLRPSQVFS